MAVNIEKCLISSVIDHGDLTEVLDARVTLEFFEDEEHTQVYTWLLKHWTEYSKVPDEATLKRNYPNYKLTAVPEPTSYYINEIRARRKYTIMQEGILASTDFMEDDDVEGAVAVISQAVNDAHAQVSSLKDENLTQTGSKRMAFYADLAANPGVLRGMSTGYEVIDRATRGIQPEQFIIIIGPPKSAKSTLLMDMAITMNEEHDAKILLVSFEMSAEEQGMRHDCMRAGVSYNKLIEGRLSKKEWSKLERVTLQDQPEFESFTLSTDIAALTTVSGIRSKLEQLKPDVVCLDGIYLMQDEHGEKMGSPQAMTNISRELKRMTQATKVPILATTQALESKISKTRGIESTSAGYTSAFGQDCNVMLGVERDWDNPGQSKLQVLLSRSGPLAKTRLIIDWETSSITEQDYTDDDAEGGDDDDDDGEKAKSKF